MSTNELYALAVAYNATRNPMFYRDLTQAELQDFWTHVAKLRS